MKEFLCCLFFYRPIMIRTALYMLILLPPFIVGQIKIDTSFEGANANILSMDSAANYLSIEPKRRYGDNNRVTFSLKVSGFDTSRPFTIRVKNGNAGHLPVLAAYSYDRNTWLRLPGIIAADGKEYSAVFTKSPLYFATGFPYLYSDILALAASWEEHPYVTVTNAAISEHGNAVKIFRFTDPTVPDSGKYLLWVTGRNHAMESHSSYVVDGLMRFLASSHAQAVRLRKQAVVSVAPMMDVDQVIAGGTGKDQSPVDFNRDWDSPSHWKAVEGIKQAMIASAVNNRMTMFIDSHNPFPGQNDNSTWFYSGYASGPKSANLDLYRTLYQNNAGIPITRSAMYTTVGQTAATWVDSMFSTVDFSTSLETGWVGRTDHTEWTIPLYQEHGANLGRAMSDYIVNIVQPGDIILDNADTSNGVLITGAWITSSSVQGFHGANYLHDNNTGKGLKSVRFTPSIPAEGDYEIFMKWSADPGRANNVPVSITYKGGMHDTAVNQQLRGGEWVSLGVYRLSAGSSGNILITTSSTTSYVIADAVRFSAVRSSGPNAVPQQSLSVPMSLMLKQNYPNPFNPATNIEFMLGAERTVIGSADNVRATLKVYSGIGQEVAVLFDGAAEPGRAYRVEFKASHMPSGIYFVRLSGGGQHQTKRMVLLK
jgi:hypothetical protein